MHIMQAHQKLFEVKSADFWAECACVCNEIKQFTSLNELLSNIGNFTLSTIFVSVNCIFPKLVVLYE